MDDGWWFPWNSLNFPFPMKIPTWDNQPTFSHCTLWLNPAPNLGEHLQQGRNLSSKLWGLLKISPVKFNDVFAGIVPDDDKGDLFWIGKNWHIAETVAGQRWKQRWDLPQGLSVLITGVEKKNKLAGKVVSPVVDHSCVIYWLLKHRGVQQENWEFWNCSSLSQHCPHPVKRPSPAADKFINSFIYFNLRLLTPFSLWAGGRADLPSNSPKEAPPAPGTRKSLCTPWVGTLIKILLTFLPLSDLNEPKLVAGNQCWPFGPGRFCLQEAD